MTKLVEWLAEGVLARLKDPLHNAEADTARSERHDECGEAETRNDKAVDKPNGKTDEHRRSEEQNGVICHMLKL